MSLYFRNKPISGASSLPPGGVKGQVLTKQSDKNQDANWEDAAHFNPNLLDNWYFLDPINQRGETIYDGLKYGIDRWSGNKSYARIEIQPNGLYVGKVPGASGTSTKNAVQLIEPSRLPLGRTVTASALVYSATSTAGVFMFGETTDEVIGSVIAAYSGKPFLISVTATLPETLTGFQFMLRAPSSESGDESVVFIAVKLELGPVQTLAHQEDGNWVLNDPPPNYALELAKCLRYQKVYYRDDSQLDIILGYAYNSTHITFPYPINMAKIPANLDLNNAVIVDSSNNELKTITRITFYGNADRGGYVIIAYGSNTEIVRGTIYALKAAQNKALVIDANL